MEGTIFATLTDQQGGMLPGATGTATSPEMSGDRVHVSNAKGKMQFEELPTGIYPLEVEMEGFSTGVRTEINVTQRELVQIDI